MAIGPKEIVENFKNQCDEIEKQIDLIIQTKSSNNFSIEAPKELTSKHFEEIKSRYLKVGWTNVTLTSNRQDSSNYLEFSFVEIEKIDYSPLNKR